MLFDVFTLREVRARPGRTALTVLSCAIGVAMIVAVGATSAVSDAGVKGLVRASAGRADFEVVGASATTFPQASVEPLAAVPGVKHLDPVFERPTSMYIGQQRVKVLLSAVDPERDAVVRGYTIRTGTFPTADGLAVDAAFAAQMKLTVGDEVKVLGRGGLVKKRVTGLIAADNPLAAKGAFALLPLADGQDLLGKPGDVTVAYVVLADGANAETVRRDLTAALPPGLLVREPAARGGLASETLRSFDEGLRLAGGLSLAVAFFITLNAFFMNVAERRRQLAVLRVVGATRAVVRRAILVEGVTLGVVGSVLGVPLGWLTSLALLASLEVVFDAPLPPAGFPLLPAVAAVLLGIATAAVAAYLPARQAADVSPKEALTAVESESGDRFRRPLLLVGGPAWLVATAGVVAGLFGLLPVSLLVPASLAWLIATAALVPLGLTRLTAVAVAVLRPFGAVESELAGGVLLHRPIRTGLTVAVLVVSVAASVALGNSVLNNLDHLRGYVRKTVVGDYFVRAMMPDTATAMAGDLPTGYAERVKALPGVTDVVSVRFVSATVSGQQAVIIVRDLPADGRAPGDLADGDPATVRAALTRGEVLLGTQLASRLKKKTGDSVELDTPTGPKAFRVAGTVTEYLVGGLVLLFETETAKRELNVGGSDVLMVTTTGDERAEVGRQLAAMSAEDGLLFQSNRDLNELIEKRLQGLEVSVNALLAIGLVVTGLGVVNCLTMNVLEQTHEIGVLRSLGLTRPQLYRMIFAQSVMMGVMSVALGVPLGLLLSYLIDQGVRVAFGQHIEFAVRFGLVGVVVGLVAVMIVAATALPARRAARINPIEALRYQ